MQALQVGAVVLAVLLGFLTLFLTLPQIATRIPWLKERVPPITLRFFEIMPARVVLLVGWIMSTVTIGLVAMANTNQVFAMAFLIATTLLVMYIVGMTFGGSSIIDENKKQLKERAHEYDGACRVIEALLYGTILPGGVQLFYLDNGTTLRKADGDTLAWAEWFGDFLVSGKEKIVSDGREGLDLRTKFTGAGASNGYGSFRTTAIWTRADGKQGGGWYLSGSHEKAIAAHAKILAAFEAGTLDAFFDDQNARSTFIHKKMIERLHEIFPQISQIATPENTEAQP